MHGLLALDVKWMWDWEKLINLLGEGKEGREFSNEIDPCPPSV